MYMYVYMYMFRRQRATSSGPNLEIRPAPLPIPASSWTNTCIRHTEINNEAAQFRDSRLQIMGIIIRETLCEVARGYVGNSRRACSIVLLARSPSRNTTSSHAAWHGGVMFVNLPAVLTLSMKNAAARSRCRVFLGFFLPDDDRGSNLSCAFIVLIMHMVTTRLVRY